jgi:hypothetical protein
MIANLPDPICEELVTRRICRRFHLANFKGNLFLACVIGQPHRWLVGDHPTLNKLAKQLRTSRTLNQALRKSSVRFGFRAGDLPPLDQTRQYAYGLPIKLKVINRAKERRQEPHPPVHPAQPIATCRVSDLFQNIAAYAFRKHQRHRLILLGDRPPKLLSCAPPPFKFWARHVQQPEKLLDLDIVVPSVEHNHAVVGRQFGDG